MLVFQDRSSPSWFCSIDYLIFTNCLKVASDDMLAGSSDSDHGNNKIKVLIGPLRTLPTQQAISYHAISVESYRPHRIIFSLKWWANKIKMERSQVKVTPPPSVYCLQINSSAVHHCSRRLLIWLPFHVGHSLADSATARPSCPICVRRRCVVIADIRVAHAA